MFLKPTRAGNARAQLISDVSTGKRISQKLLRNIVKFMSIIDDVLKILPMEFLKKSSDEVEMRGSESKYDTRRLNSYPSKVFHGHGPLLPYMHFSEVSGSVWSFLFAILLCAIHGCIAILSIIFSSFIQNPPPATNPLYLSLSVSPSLLLAHTQNLRLPRSRETKKESQCWSWGVIKILQMVPPSSP